MKNKIKDNDRYLEITKSYTTKYDTEEEYFIEGKASNNLIDSQGDIISESVLYKWVEQIKGGKQVIIENSHNREWSGSMGVVIDAWTETVGEHVSFYVKAKLDPLYPFTQMLMRDLDNDINKFGFSIFGGTLESHYDLINVTGDRGEKLDINVRVIDEANLDRIAITLMPANSDTYVVTAKTKNNSEYTLISKTDPNKLSNLNNEVNDFKGKDLIMEKIEQKIKDLESNLEKTISKITDMNENLENQKKENEKLKDELAKAKEELSEKDDVVKITESENIELAKIALEKKEELEKNKEELDAEKLEKTNVFEKIEALTKQIEDLKKEPEKRAEYRDLIEKSRNEKMKSELGNYDIHDLIKKSRDNDDEDARLKLYKIHGLI